ncbi:MAG: hypothetical protein EKK57_11130 [Proteobacteria bacterium]|nr:MAG: hypothetical protein EKK57_11130 [Pseudomonadota bacterium]
MAHPNVISTQDINNLFIGVSTAFSQLTFDEKTVADKISFLNQNASGEQFDYPFSPVAGKEEVWLEGAQRKVGAALMYKITGSHKRIAPPDEMLFDSTLRYDVYGVLEGKLSAIASRAKRVWDRQLASMILTNPAGFDGVSLWNTAHPVNPNNVALGTYTNDLVGFDIDQPGLSSALNTLKQIRWMDGQILEAQDTGLVILVPTYALYVKARQLIFGSLIPNVFGANTAAAGVSNPFAGMEGMVRDVVLLPELVDPTVANSDKFWYVLNCSHPVHRPLVTSVVKMPEFHYSGLDPNDWVRVQLGGITYGWDAIGGVAPGLPQFTVRVLAP